MSCAEIFEGSDTWASDVKDTQLESPAAADISVRFVTTTQGYQQVLSWPVVMGAGGYQVTVWNVDDPDNPVAVGERDEVIDGLSVRRDATEDTRYKVTIKTMGNPEYNNTEAAAATEYSYTNLLPVTAVIPDGSDLTAYFTDKTMDQWYGENEVDELCFELVPGGSYTMTGHVRQGMRNVTLRGDKLDHPTVKVTDGSFVNSGAGLKLRFMDLDYTEFEGTPNANALVLMDSEFNAAGATLTSNSYLLISPDYPVQLDGLKVTGLKSYIFWDSGRKYAIGTFLIKDCIIGHRTATFNAALMRFQTGMVKDLTMTASTFYNDNPPAGDNSQRFLQISSGNATSVGGAALWANGSMSVINCTFWQVSKFNQLGNSNGGMRTGGDKVEISKSVFVDSGQQSGNIWNFRCRNVNNFTGGKNTQQWGGESLYERTGSDENTRDTDFLTGDPKLEYLGNGEFRMSGAEQIADKTGDPRWLPAN